MQKPLIQTKSCFWFCENYYWYLQTSDCVQIIGSCVFVQSTSLQHFKLLFRKQISSPSSADAPDVITKAASLPVLWCLHHQIFSSHGSTSSAIVQVVSFLNIGLKYSMSMAEIRFISDFTSHRLTLKHLNFFCAFGMIATLLYPDHPHTSAQ